MFCLLFQIVAMSRIVTQRLNVFQVIINIEAPPWRQPRLYPAQEFTDEEVYQSGSCLRNVDTYFKFVRGKNYSQMSF